MSKLKLILPLILLGIFMLSTFSVVSTVTDGGDGSSTDSQDHNGVPDQQEQADHRQVQVQYSLTDKNVQIQSQNSYNGSSTQIQIELSAKEGLKVSFEFGGEVNHTETELHIGLEARKVVEFNNTNTAVAGYDVNDTLLNTIDLRTANWTISVANTTVANDTLWTINATAPLGSSGTIEFQFQLSNGYALIAGNNTLAPNALKWTVVISGYQYTDSSSQLALQMLMNSGSNNDGFESHQIQNQTEDSKDGLSHDNESQVSFGNGSTGGFYSWADNYTLDGQSLPVITSPSVTVDKEDSTQNQLFFSFNQGNVINWDPKVGVTRTTTSSYTIAQVASSSTSIPTSNSGSTPQSSKSTPGFEMIAVIFSFGTIAFISKRKYKN